MDKYLIPIAIIVAGVLIAGTVWLTQDSSTNNVRNVDPDASLAEILEQTKDDRVALMSNIEMEEWPYLGDEDAPIVMVEYSDFACPYCGVFEGEALPLIKEEYIDAGIVRFIYKDFAVVGGDRAAEAAHCAAEQDSYWDYHDLLFERQDTDRNNWDDAQVHLDYALQLGLDADSLVECFEDRRYRDKVRNSTMEAQGLGASGTPHFFINGFPISGAQSFNVFEMVIEELLIID